MTPEPPPRGRLSRSGGLRLVPPDLRHGLGGKIIGVANAGHRLRVGISLADCRHHLHVLGPDRDRQDHPAAADDPRRRRAAGRGVAAFDPAKGDLIRDLLDRAAGRLRGPAGHRRPGRDRPRPRRSTCSTRPCTAVPRTTWPPPSPA